MTPIAMPTPATIAAAASAMPTITPAVDTGAGGAGASAAATIPCTVSRQRLIDSAGRGLGLVRDPHRLTGCEHA